MFKQHKPMQRLMAGLLSAVMALSALPTPVYAEEQPADVPVVQTEQATPETAPTPTGEPEAPPAPTGEPGETPLTPAQQAFVDAVAGLDKDALVELAEAYFADPTEQTETAFYAEYDKVEGFATSAAELYAALPAQEQQTQAVADSYALLQAIIDEVNAALGMTTPTEDALTTYAQPANGDGSPDAPYQITTAGELRWFAGQVNGGQTTINGKLMADIKLNGDTKLLNDKGELAANPASLIQWTPIGNSFHNLYKGTFDGDGHTVSGVYIDNTANNQGLFGYVDGGTLKNLGVVDSYISAGDRVGGVCGLADSATITNCYNTGTVSAAGGGATVGGVCGNARGSSTLTNNYNTGTVTATGDNAPVGGVCGSASNSTLTNNYYQTGSATVGVGNAEQDTPDQTAPKTADEFASGEVTWLLNGSEAQDNKNANGELIWRQNLDSQSKDPAPVLDAAHSIVYKSVDNYTNTEPKQEPSKEGDFYLITSDDELHWFAQEVNGGQNDINGKLMADIKLNGDTKLLNENGDLVADPTSLTQWTPIGGENKYAGIFDGNGHTVSGVYINDTAAQYQGLFGYVEDGTVKNLGVVDSYISARSDVGGVCGRAYTSTITNCYNTGKVTAAGNYATVGGVCGYVGKSTLTNNYNTGTLTATAPYADVGGVCGDAYNSTLTNNYNTGTLTATGNNASVGGVCGYVYGTSTSTLTNNYNTGTVTAAGINANVGGVYGNVYGASTLTNNYNTGTVSAAGSGAYVGGVCGNEAGVSNTLTNTLTNNYYLTGSATVGVGNAEQDTPGETAAKTADEFASGEVTWLLNGSEAQDNKNANGELIWRQNLDSQSKDPAPVLDAAHSIVYKSGEGYTNTEPKQEPSKEGDFYLITTADELRWYAGQVNGGQTTINGKLMADIKLNVDTPLLNKNGDLVADPTSLTQWTPIGNYGDPYVGIFDGNNHTVSGVYIDTTANNQGLFGCIEGGTVKNLGVENSYISAGDYVGGVCGLADSATITNCYNTGTVRAAGGGAYVGGVCGNARSSSTLTNNYNTGTVTATGVAPYVGGVCGSASSSTLTNNYYQTGKGASKGVGNVSTDNDAQTAPKTQAQFASGEVTWLLNGSDATNTVWRQNLESQSTDPAPVLDATHSIVYKSGDNYTNTEPPSEPGKDGDFYLITSAGELRWFAEQVNGGQTTINGKLMADIKLNGDTKLLNDKGELIANNAPDTPWTPIGNSFANFYKGIFDGNGHTVSGVYINDTAEYQGLFGLVDGGTLKNLGVVDSYISANDHVGGVCGGALRAIIENCYNTGTVTATGVAPYVGGVCGQVGDSALTNNYNTGTLTATGNNASVGGVCGYASSSILTNNYNTGTLTATGEGAYVGGVCGRAAGATFTNNYYLTGSATVGVGNAEQDTPAQTAPKTAAEFASGEVTWLLNGSEAQNNKNANGELVWRQNLAQSTDPDPAPVLNAAHSIVYKSGDKYTNTVPKQEPSKDGDGTYLITTADDLRWFAEKVNGGSTTINGKLMADIKLNGENKLLNDKGDLIEANAPATQWTPIGNTSANSYKGTFDGDGHTVSGVYINDTAANNQGLFGYVDGGTLKNLGVVDSYISARSDVSGVCGRVASGTITNCYNTGTATAAGVYAYVGGVCGYVYGNSTLTNNYNTGTLTATGVYASVGGVCGSAHTSTITNNYNTGTVTAVADGANVGDVCGRANGSTLTNNYNTGTVTATGEGAYVGGVCGNAFSSILTNNYNTGTVSAAGSGASVGGVCGYSYSGTLANNYYQTEKGATVGVGNVLPDDNAQTAAKTQAEFASGEIAYWLQQAQQTETPQVWGQKLGENADAYPLLTDEKPVYAGQYYTGENADQTVFYANTPPQNAQDAPQFTTTITPTSITVTVTNQSSAVGTIYYRLGDSAWQQSNQFTGLTPNTEYTITVMFGGDETRKYAETAQVCKTTAAQYTISIPASATIDTDTDTDTPVISVTEWNLTGGSVNVTVNQTNVELTRIGDDTTKVTTTIQKESANTGTYEDLNGTNVANFTGNGQSVKLKFTTPTATNTIPAGNYSGSVVFTISSVPAA